MNEPWVALLSAVLKRSPKLPNALCVQDPDLFTSVDPLDIEDAVATCHRCPDIGPCRAYVATLPRTAMRGVVIAGQVRRGHRQEQVA